MTGAPVNPGQDDNDDATLDQWLSQLAGHAPADPETQALRQALQDQASRPDHMPSMALSPSTLPADSEPPAPGVDHDEAQALKRLRLRLRQEGLLQGSIGPSPVPVPAPRPAARGVAAVLGSWWPSLAGGLLILALAAVLWPASWRATQVPPFQVVQAEPPTWRDARSLPVHRVDDPLRLGQQMAQATAKLQGRPVLYQWAGQVVLDFDLSPEQVATAQQLLAQAGVNQPVQAGVNRVIFQARTTP